MKKVNLNILEKTVESVIRVIESFNLEARPDKKINYVFEVRDHFAREVQRREKKVSYPFVGFVIDSIEINPESYNKNAIQFLQPVQFDRESEYLTVNLVPIVANLGVIFRCDDYKDYLNFVTFWMMNTDRLNYEIIFNKNPDLSMGIRVILSTSVQSPDYSLDDVGDLYSLESNLALHTYVGVCTTQNPLNKVNLNIHQVEPNAIQSSADPDFDFIYEIVTVEATP
jgi:hypothetical protein